MWCGFNEDETEAPLLVSGIMAFVACADLWAQGDVNRFRVIEAAVIHFLTSAVQGDEYRRPNLTVLGHPLLLSSARGVQHFPVLLVPGLIHI